MRPLLLIALEHTMTAMTGAIIVLPRGNKVSPKQRLQCTEMPSEFAPTDAFGPTAQFITFPFHYCTTFVK